MSKRFTDTNKWDHSWFRKLEPKYKCAWFYLLDKCDHAGIWIEDFEAMSFNIGQQITRSEFEEIFFEKLKKTDSDKYIIESFVEFQYGNLNENNKVHKSVIQKLSKIQGATKGLPSPINEAKEKDKDKDKEKDKEMEKEKEKEKEIIIHSDEKKETRQIEHPIVKLFNELSHKHQMPIVKVLNDSRKKALIKAIRDIGDDPKTWERVFLVAGTKGFLKSDGSSWSPSFDYVFRNANYVKFSEEDLTNRPTSKAKQNSNFYQEFYDNNPYEEKA